MDERAEFERAMRDNPDDIATHRIYADWLSERGHDDEAAYHRRWTPAVRVAERWFENLGGQHFNPYDIDSEKGIPAEELIQAGHDWLAKGESYTQHGDETLQEFMWDEFNRRQFWDNWEMATGIKPPDGTEQDGFIFRCAC